MHYFGFLLIFFLNIRALFKKMCNFAFADIYL